MLIERLVETNKARFVKGLLCSSEAAWQKPPTLLLEGIADGV